MAKVPPRRARVARTAAVRSAMPAAKKPTYLRTRINGGYFTFVGQLVAFLRPRRRHVIGARIGNRLAQMLVHVVSREKQNSAVRHFLSEELGLFVQIGIGKIGDHLADMRE